MKKLMIAVSAVMMACAVNAANYIWGFTGGGQGDIYQPGTEEYLESGTAFLFLGTVTASESAFDTSAATLVTTGGFDDELYAFGNINTENLSSSSAIVADSSQVGQAYSLILVDQAGLTSLDGYDGNYYMASGTSVITVVPGATLSYYADLTNADVISGSSWSTMGGDVPEPTSGLLMLIGVAGLALRRKCA